MTVAVRAEWGLPHLVLSGLTAAVVASSPLGMLQTLQSVDLTHLRLFGTEAAAPPLAAAAAVPGAAPPFVLAARTPADYRQAVRCLSQAIYYEAGFQPLDGQRAIAQVILNRMRDRRFPDTVCGVVYQGWTRRTGCQFSFVCDGSLWRRPPTSREMQSAAQVAVAALSGYVEADVGTATHYHTLSVRPAWRDTLVMTARIGAHVFYRWPGKAGRPEALTQVYGGDEVRVAVAGPRAARG